MIKISPDGSTAEYRNHWAGPRWLRVESAIRNICNERGLKAEVEVETGWIGELGRLTVSGPRQAVEQFATIFERTYASYTNE